MSTSERIVGNAGEPATVLICDDEVRLAALTAGLLEEYGCRPLIVSTGTEALTAVFAADPPVDLLLLDVHLAVGPSAREILDELDQRGLRMPVILTSGFAAEDIPADLMEHPSIAAYVPKPYKADDLVTVVRQTIATR